MAVTEGSDHLGSARIIESTIGGLKKADNSKRRNCLLGGTLAGVLVLAHAVGLYLGGDHQSQQLVSALRIQAQPNRTYSTPNGTANPYSIENDTLVETPSMLTGYLKASSEKLEDFARFAA